MTATTATFEHLARRFRDGTLTAASNRFASGVTCPQPGEIARMPESGTPAHQELLRLGQEALERGELGSVILSGGMATRFNYALPKGCYPIYEQQSFLELKIRWIRQAAPQMPIYVMTSFATDDAVQRHFAEHAGFGARDGQLHCFTQYRFPRLHPDGSPFKSPDGSEDFAAPGHGDFPSAIQASGLLDSFLAQGGKYLLFSNVDNLGATVDLAIVGWHIQQGREMTVEVAAKAPGDKGGAPARVNGKLQLVEGFAFPEDFDQDSIPVFNTATYVFTAEALQRPLDLPWYVVEKTVDGQRVIQFEHLAGDLSCHLSTGYLEVDRDERFIPVKSQADVPEAQAKIRRKLGLKASV
jgi:UTP--glucose-1-phosphate uridylyltransferase